MSRRLDHLLASSPTTIYANEAAGDNRCTYVSANLGALTGYEPRHMRADPRFWFERVHSEDRARVLAHCSDPAKLQDGVLLYRFRRADDTYIWIHDRHRLIYDAAGKVVELVGAWTDVSSHKALEQELIRARDEARQATQAKSEFLATVSHEIRTPMNGVIGMLEVLKQTRLSAEQGGFVETAARSAET
ncbi:MAG: PAS domain-containing protein, partial [Methylococcales bacterium]